MSFLDNTLGRELRTRSKIKYPKAAEIKRVVNTARALGFDVSTLEIRADGTVKVSDARGRSSDSDEFSRWDERL